MFSKSAIINNLRAERKKLEETLETVREFVLNRRSDIEKDMEDFGMLKPVLNHFLKEAEEEPAILLHPAKIGGVSVAVEVEEEAEGR